jgi:hypothetical protein
VAGFRFLPTEASFPFLAAITRLFNVAFGKDSRLAISAADRPLS